MTGYQELVTDPSYAEQILCFTAPMVGNYGVCKGRSESGGVHVQGVVMREAQGPAWTDWLVEHGVVALDGIDTRSLVLHLRDRGAMWAAIGTGEEIAAGRGRDGGEGARRRRLDARAVPLRRGRPRERRGRRLRDEEVDPAPARRIGRGGDGLPAHGRRRHARRPRRRRPLERPRRPRPARRGDGGRPRPARPHAGLRHLPRPPAARAGDRARDVQAAVRPPRREPPGARARRRAACSSPRRTTASR